MYSCDRLGHEANFDQRCCSKKTNDDVNQLCNCKRNKKAMQLSCLVSLHSCSQVSYFCGVHENLKSYYENELACSYD